MGKKIQKYFRIYWPFAANQIKTNFAYKGRFYLYMVRKFLGMFIYYYLWMAIYAGAASDTLGGFSRGEMILYVFMSYTISDLIMMGISSEIGYDVIEGNVAMNLIKPINYRTNLMFNAFGVMVYRLVMPSLFIWAALEAYKVIGLGQSISSPLRILYFLLSLFLSFLVYAFFDYCFGMLAFVTTYIFGMNIIKNAVLNFLSGRLIPMTFFPAAVQTVFEFLPFTAMTYVPVMIYLGKYSETEVIMQLGKQAFWAVVLCLFGNFLWQKVQKRIVILGG